MASDDAGPVAELLASVPLFRGLEPSALSAIAGLVLETAIDSGETITIEGEVGYDSFIVVAGTANVSVSGQSIATIGPGSFVGEMALLDGNPRSATVTATSPMRVLLVDAAALATLLESPPVAARILSGIVQRLRQTDTALGTAARAPAEPDEGSAAPG
jgi:CRP/FNR family transcriptional regulator, cyclic AMP receptor protein